eukprot:755022-Hanusia_phi.AAC.5
MVELAQSCCLSSSKDELEHTVRGYRRPMFTIGRIPFCPPRGSKRNLAAPTLRLSRIFLKISHSGCNKPAEEKETTFASDRVISR